MRKNRIVKGVVSFFFHLSVYTFMSVGGLGVVLEFASPMAIASMPMWNFAAFGVVSLACITGIYVFGNKLDRIHATEERSREARAELLAAWRR